MTIETRSGLYSPVVQSDSSARRTGSRRTASKGRKGSVDVEAALAKKSIPAKDVSGAPAQSSVFMRGVQAIPSALSYLASSAYKAVKEVFIEGLVSYFIFSRAAGMASSVSRATGADINGMMGVITVPVRKLTAKAATGLWNLVFSSAVKPRTPADGQKIADKVIQKSGYAANPENSGLENSGPEENDAEENHTDEEGSSETTVKGKRKSAAVAYDMELPYSCEYEEEDSSSRTRTKRSAPQLR